MAVSFKKAQREQIKIKVAVHGPAGSGKTEGALMLARQLVGPDGRIAAVDTERRAMSLYADRYEFDVIDLAPPFESKFFAEAIDVAVAGGYDALIIDSLSHQWEGPGSIKDRKDREEMQQGAKANGFALWNKYKAEHRRFFDKLLQADLHVVACFRAREEHAQGIKDGRKVVEKLGMAPITGEGVEYEFRVVFALNMGHWAEASKDNTGLFDGRTVNIRDDRPGEVLARWLAEGAVPAAPPTPAERASRVLFPFHKGKPEHDQPIGTLPTPMLQSAVDGVRKHRDAKRKPEAYAAFYDAALLVLDARGESVIPDEAPASTPVGGEGGTSAATAPVQSPAEPAAGGTPAPAPALPDPVTGTGADYAEAVGKARAATKVVPHVPASQREHVPADAGDGLPF